jgi:hypothetical protein
MGTRLGIADSRFAKRAVTGRMSSWFAKAKGRRRLAFITGLVGAAAGLAGSGGLFPISVVRAAIGVALAGIAVWGAFRTDRDRISAALMMLLPGVFGIFLMGWRWIPACFILLAAAIFDGPAAEPNGC